MHNQACESERKLVKHMSIDQMLLIHHRACVSDDACYKSLMAVQDCSVLYSTNVVVPQCFRKAGADPSGDCSIRLGLARFAASVKPIEMQSDIELCDLTLTYAEQPANVPGELLLPFHDT